MDRLTPDRGSGDDEKMNDPKDDGGEEEDEEEAKCKAVIEVEKKVYRGSFQVRRMAGVHSMPTVAGALRSTLPLYPAVALCHSLQRGLPRHVTCFYWMG